MSDPVAERTAEIYATESRRVLSTLIRVLGDFDLAEEALQEAFGAALTAWPVDGIPDNPRAWLVSAGKFRGIDAIRRRGRGTEIAVQAAREREDAISPTDCDGRGADRGRWLCRT